MGLLDFLNQDSSGYGGLFGGQYFPTIEQPKLPNSQIEYDAAGNPMGVSQAPAPSPFPQWSPTQSSAPPQMPSQTPIFAGAAPYGMPQPTPQAPALPAPINVPQNPLSNPVAMAAPAVDSAAIPANAQPTQYQPPQSNDGPGIGDRLLAGLTNFGAGGKSGGLIGALSGGIGGLTTGQRQDAVGIQQQQQSATFKALVASGMPHNVAMAATLNPELLKQIAPQYFPKPEFKTLKDEYGQERGYVWDPTERTLKPAAGGTASATNGDTPGTVTGPDGKQIPIPPGVDPKEFRRRVTQATADNASGKRTEVQQKADQFASRMELAEKNVRGLEDQAGGASGVWNAIAGSVPVVGGLAQTGQYQKYDQAKSNFITALLRQESGAAIGKSEFTRYDKEFFPQPGDTQEVINQKREARRVATDAMRRGAGGQAATNSNPSGVTAGGVKWSVQ